MNWGYISAFFYTIGLNCIQPVNIEACLRVNEWLIPAAHDYMRLQTEGIYASEKRALEQFRLDGSRTKPQ